MASIQDELSKPIGIIGAGAAGLITAHTLIKDGFSNVQILTRDASVGGVWARTRIYPGLLINNVHGEFSFSSLPMPPPAQSDQTGGRLSGSDMCAYMELFAERFLQGKIQFNTEILNIRRIPEGTWVVSVLRKESRQHEELSFSRIVLCTGGCSAPAIPRFLSPKVAEETGFKGVVIHSSEFSNRYEEIKKIVGQTGSGRSPDGYAGSVVVVGGGKSAQDISTRLANDGRKVTMVFEKIDAMLAVPKPLPAFIRRSRFLAVLSPHIELRSRLERFLHTTWLGGKIVRFIWDQMTSSSFDAAHIPKDSPLRNSRSIFWGARATDEGVPRPNGFHNSVNAGKIELMAPNHVQGFGDDGESLILQDGRKISADVVILATGFDSSWKDIFDASTSVNLGISRRPPVSRPQDQWNYTSFAHPPKPSQRQGSENSRRGWLSAIHRGIVPAKNIMNRDFAINGAMLATNVGYTYEVIAHWTASYFRGDKLKLPSSVSETMEIAERNANWLRTRYPDITPWVNESYSSGVAYWDWPQYIDTLLDDMGLPVYRSGGTWFNWIFRVIDLKELEHLTEERRQKRLVDFGSASSGSRKNGAPGMNGH